LVEFWYSNKFFYQWSHYCSNLICVLLVLDGWSESFALITRIEKSMCFVPTTEQNLCNVEPISSKLFVMSSQCYFYICRVTQNLNPIRILQRTNPPQVCRNCCKMYRIVITASAYFTDGCQKLV
jgi:hypothetical protein